MKKLVFITDGNVLRAFRLSSTDGIQGLEFEKEEIPVSFDGGESEAQKSAENGDVGKSAGGAGEAERETNPDRIEAFRLPSEIDDEEVKYIALLLERIIRIEKPDLWHLMAPSRLANEIRPALTKGARERLASY